MNGRQAARKAAILIEELERLNKLYAGDVKDYYDCIEGTVDGKSICDWCDDQEECQLQDKGSKGCKEWVLRTRKEEPQDEQSGTDQENHGENADN